MKRIFLHNSPSHSIQLPPPLGGAHIAFRDGSGNVDVEVKVLWIENSQQIFGRYYLFGEEQYWKS